MILHSQPSDPASWTVLAAPQRLLALAEADPAQLGELSAHLADADGFRSVLEVLLGGGIAGAPSFALLDSDAAVLRVVVRGEAEVTVFWHDPDAAELSLSGVGMATWLEQVVEGARSIQLQCPGGRWTLELAPGESQAPTEPPFAAPTAVADSTASLTPGDAPELLEPEQESYDFLFGNTVYRTQAGLAINMPNPDPDRAGDHDGHTMLAEVPGRRDRTAGASVPASLPASQPSSPPEETLAPPTLPPTPSLALAATLQLERPDGSREPLRQPIIVGRAPSVSAAAVPEPRLITIPDDKDISRSHVRIAVEGDAVVVTDLASKNGTVVTLPGGTPRKLRGGEATVVLPGTIIDLGGGIHFTVRED